jgi:nitrite reductase/ring-hydroxylating ferredoxin subunit
LADGTVVSGPASRPQPVLDARVVDGRVQVRRAPEPRALRTNPVGH